MFNFSGKRPDGLGLRDGQLGLGPRKPNWVCSRADTDAAHRVEPLQVPGNRTQAMTRLLAVLRATPGATVVREEGDYVHAEFRTRLMGFVDDVEFHLPDNSGTIQVRSASRLGYSDVGVNRKRVEMLRKALAAP